MAVVIGLTGSTGVGKTAVANVFRGLGCEVADADVVAKGILIEDGELLRREHPHWFFDGKLSFRLIAEEIFAEGNRALYDAYCQYLWPKTRARVQEMIAASSADVFIYDAALLFEAESDRICDVTLLVTADEAVRKERSLARSGWTAEQFDQRQGFLWSQEEKARLATLRLHNDGGLEDLEERARALLLEVVPRVVGREFSTGSLEDAWLLANRWWLGDSLRVMGAWGDFLAGVGSRGGYHSLSHIERMLERYRQWCGVMLERPDPRLVGWLFAHDLVYVPGAADNESESAALMDRLLEGMVAYRRMGRDDRTAIESTKGHLPVDAGFLDEPELVGAIHLLQDLDLEILGASRSEYEGYRLGVYAEYLAASDDPLGFDALWRVGRSAFLEGMLGRERIYKTPLFAMFEQHARENMADELANLLGG